MSHDMEARRKAAIDMVEDCQRLANIVVEAGNRGVADPLRVRRHLYELLSIAQEAAAEFTQ